MVGVELALGHSCPAGHEWHRPSPSLLCVPPGHKLGVAAPPGQKVPAGHGVHTALPSREAYRPAGQGVHDEANGSLELPARHAVGCTLALGQR